jgi:putative CocE/NonD family hydrolase
LFCVSQFIVQGKIPVDLPALHISGWYDEAYGPSGAVSNFVQQQKHNTHSRLIIGPWTHGEMEVQSAGDVDFGEIALEFVYDDLVVDFLREQLVGVVPGQRSSVPVAPVNIFQMGDNRWLRFDSWPPPTEAKRIFLRPDKTLGEEAVAPAVVVASVASDPARPVTDPFASEYGAHDYSRFFAETEPTGRIAVFRLLLDRDWPVAGYVRIAIHFSTSAPSLDIWARVFDSGINLAHPGAEMKRWHRSQPPVIVVDHLVTANNFKRGHELQLMVSGSFAPHLSVNLQTGESEIHSFASAPAAFEILSSSHIELPVLTVNKKGL